MKQTNSISTIPHTPGEWEVVKEPGFTVANGIPEATTGLREKCTVCGEVLDSEVIEASSENVEENFKQACGEFSYEDVARNPDSHKGKYAYFEGKVLQVMEYGNSYILRVAKNSDYGSVMHVEYTTNSNDPRILEDDVITLWGELDGIETYEAVMGNSVSIPRFQAYYLK